MVQSTVKPLPDIPPDPVLRRLSVESNALIHTLIERALSDEGLDVSWTASIKRALADLGECVVSGQWLPGLRKARKAQNDARAREDKATRERTRKERERLSELKAGRPKASDKAEPKEVEIRTAPSKKERQSLALKDIRTLTSVFTTPIPSLSPKHLLITISSQPTELSDGDPDFDFVPASKQCIFLPDTYSLPFFEDKHGNQGDGGIVVCGLDTWNVDEKVKPRIVGGNFVFRNLTSATVHESLAAVLRLSIYTYLSLTLEQTLLSNSHVALQFPPPPPQPPSITPLQSSVPASPTPSSSKRKTRVSKPSSSIWSFLSKKTENIFHRSTPDLRDADEVPTRASSLDLSSVFSSARPSRRASDATAPESTISTIRGSRVDDTGPFTSAVQGIRDPQCILSTSPGVEFPLPPLLARLATQEQNRIKFASESSGSASSVDTGSNSTLSGTTAIPTIATPPGLRLTGPERAGLGSMLGWEGREGRGRGMTGVRGFVRHQGLTVLRAEHVSRDVPCGRPRLVTFRYWARSRTEDTEMDQTLGELVERMCEMAEEPCETEGCDKPRGRHNVSWTCSGVRICGAIKADTGNSEVADGECITMWESCVVCGQSKERMRMDDGTYLYSFAKFLELLLWSPMLASLPLCEHTTSPTSPPTVTPFCILRHFSWGGRVLTFSITSIHADLFEIRLPKLQVISGSVPKEEKQLAEARRKRDGVEERQVLFTEVDEWWKGFKIRLDALDTYLQQEADAALEGKDLPPLPITDDKDLDEELSKSWLSDRVHTPSPQRPQASRATSLGSLITSRPSTPRLKTGKPAAAPYPPGLPISIHQSRQLLVQLRSSFQRTEDTVLQQVSENPHLSLNDLRRTFRSTARGAFKRLVAWQKKHAPGAPADGESDLELEWWHGTCHAVPGGRVLVREDEWGSVIAFTLSSRDYQRELASLTSGTILQLSSPPSATNLSEQFTSNTITTTKTHKSVITALDPDDIDATTFWEEPEPWTAVITRREHPREMSSLLSLRDVLRNKKSFEGSSLGSRFTGSVSRGVPPPSAWTLPQVQVNLQSADGQVGQFPEAAEIVERVLGSQHPGHHQAEPTLDSDDMPTPTPSSFVDRNIRSGKSESIVSFVQLERNGQQENSISSDLPAGLPITSSPSPVGQGSEPSSATSASSFGSALSSAMRYFLSTGSPTPSRPSSPTPSSAPHHGLLALETTPIDDRPHIKYDWTIGKRLKFSCTVYYAKQFDALRKRCGVGDSMLKSLERTESWTAVGGKSKSNFWKSADDRFIIKTLVNAWNVADLQVLIDLGPSYFRYVESTASKPSVLAKLMGFYTVEVKNLETGAVQAKADLLVMENLFYKQKVSKTFDLKGIQSRRVKTNSDTEQRTLFDGEWIDGQQRSPLLIQPHSMLILQEAIKSDADFLARSNIMDYSLLLGIDEDRHEIACGLVDTIGSYTFAKTLEYKAKQNLNSGKGKEVTVMPPAEYQNRFVNAMEGYFLACPDKWTKPSHYVDRTSPCDLASVL